MQPLSSMTGFSSVHGQAEGVAWRWEIRSVNGRGLELRLRLPAGFDSLEPALRRAAAALHRGNIQATLSLEHADSGRTVTVDEALLARFAAIASAAACAHGAPPPRIEVLMALPGVVNRDSGTMRPPDERSLAAILANFSEGVGLLVQARREEGARIAAVLDGQIDALAEATENAALAAGEALGAQRARIETSVQQLIETAGVAEDRMLQELALLAARADIAEEIDRLRSHVAAARALLSSGGPAGRQLDFLTQEFLREANTLCSKAATPALTRIGLAMKGHIEQFREQVQNIE